MRGLGIISIAAIAFLLFCPGFENFIISTINRIHFPPRWQTNLVHVLEQFLQGATSFQNPGRFGLFLLLTCGIWLLDGIVMIFSARAFSIEFQLNQALLLLVGLGLSSAIPAVPGNIGVYQFVAVTILAIYGYPQSQALAFILVVQAIGMLIISRLGGNWPLETRNTDPIIITDEF